MVESRNFETIDSLTLSISSSAGMSTPLKREIRKFIELHLQLQPLESYLDDK